MDDEGRAIITTIGGKSVTNLLTHDKLEQGKRSTRVIDVAF